MVSVLRHVWKTCHLKCQTASQAVIKDVTGLDLRIIIAAQHFVHSPIEERHGEYRYNCVAANTQFAQWNSIKTLYVYISDVHSYSTVYSTDSTVVQPFHY